MYTSIRIENFRAHRDLNVEGLKRINLFVGRNNSGKTSLLEAIFLLGGATNPSLAMAIGYNRGQRFEPSHPDSDPIWRSFFTGFDPEMKIEIAGKREQEKAARRLTISADAGASEEVMPDESGVLSAGEEFRLRRLRLAYKDALGRGFETSAALDPRAGRVTTTTTQRDDFVRSTFVSARSHSTLARDTEQFGYLLRMKRDQEVLEAIRLVEPAIKRLEVVPEAGASTIYADVGLAALVPLMVCGEGTVRLFSIIVQLTASRGGVLLIDEIDNGLHHSVMHPFWERLGALARKHDVQIFATTHNEELIQAALDAFGEQYTDLGLYRIDREDGSTKAVRYSEPALQAVHEEGFEVRG